MAHLISRKYPNHFSIKFVMLCQFLEVYRSQFFSSLSSPNRKKWGKTSNINQNLIYDAIYIYIYTVHKGYFRPDSPLKSDILMYWKPSSSEVWTSNVPKNPPNFTLQKLGSGSTDRGRKHFGGRQGKLLENPIGSMNQPVQFMAGPHTPM